MILNRKSVELLAPAGNWDALVAAVEAGADAVYLGGKHFNMRMHRNKETNFDDEMLKKAMENNSVDVSETAEWLDDEEELARICGIR